jgi:hypothetical protein
VLSKKGGEKYINYNAFFLEVIKWHKSFMEL